jgi:hypothetical protein
VAPDWSKAACPARPDTATRTPVSPETRKSEAMLRRRVIFNLTLIAVTLSAICGSRAEDLPTLHDRVVTTLYGPAYRLLFLGERAIPAWIKQYNSNHDAKETPGLRVYFDGAFFERYKVCDPHQCDASFMVVLFTPGGREAWAVSVSDGQQQFFGHPDAVTQQRLIAVETQP